MADELKDITDKGTGHEGNPERSDRTKERIEDLVGKLKSTSDALEEEKQARKNLEFELGFDKFEKKYPNASELKDNIKKAVDSGIPLETAAIAELHKVGKLMTSEQIKKEQIVNENIGGSADTHSVGATKNEPQTSAEMRQKLIELENEGKLRFDGEKITLRQ